jgi:L-fuconolactonase
MRSAELGEGAKLIDACPGTSFVLDHCGNPDVFNTDRSTWQRAIGELARRRNVVCKVSGIVASTRGRSWRPDDLAPVINHVLKEFGPDRVVFGGDWPVCTLGARLADWVKALREVVANRSEADQRKLFHDNAVRVYRLG